MIFNKLIHENNFDDFFTSFISACYSFEECFEKAISIDDLANFTKHFLGLFIYF